MTINLSTPTMEAELKPRIVVVGVGGAGGNAVNNMIRSELEGVDFVVCNTDSQALTQSQADRRIQLGAHITQGLGAGARPDIGRAAAEESMDEIIDHLTGANMVFITGGMGGGTGTGAAPVIARLAREKGILTVGVVTKPFHFEGSQRMRSAESGIEELQQYVDTLIIIPNQNLFRVANEKTTFADAFKMADDVLYSGVRGVTDLMVMPGLINLDFADIRTVMSEMGKAMMGTGESEGETRAIMAAEAAISNPLLDDVTMRGARGVLINITGGMDMTLFEVDEAANRIREEVDNDANIIFGSTFDDKLDGTMRVSVVATGIEADSVAQPRSFPMGIGGNAIGSNLPKAEPVQETKPAAVASAAEMTEAPIFNQAETLATENAQDEQPPLFPSSLDAVEADDAFDAKPDVAEDSFIPPAPEMPSISADAMPDAPAGKSPEAIIPRDAFIPPQPASPEEANTEEKSSKDPFVGSVEEVTNPYATEPVTETKPRAKAGFFRQMTGLLQGKSKQAPEASQKPVRQEPAAAPITRPETPAPVASTAQQASIPTPSNAEEEMLEIPAFLRRQAN